MGQQEQLLRHYGRDDLTERLAAALRAAGLGDRRLTPDDLAPLDQFHTRGMRATVELAAAVGVTGDARVVDIGSGLGGPSRYLAATFGCRVEGVDLSPAFVRAAGFLADRAGLADKVSYQAGDALALPFEDGRFDLAWTQHVAMNIADRGRLYAEVHRVLRRGGKFAVYDVVAGEGGAPHYPVPWSRAPDTSFLLTSAAMRVALEEAGFRVVAWTDFTAAGVAWFAAQQATRERTASSPATLGLHLAMGEDFPTMTANLGRNLREGRNGIIQAVLERA